MATIATKRRMPVATFNGIPAFLAPRDAVFVGDGVGGSASAEPDKRGGAGTERRPGCGHGAAEGTQTRPQPNLHIQGPGDGSASGALLDQASGSCPMVVQTARRLPAHCSWATEAFRTQSLRPREAGRQNLREVGHARHHGPPTQARDTDSPSRAILTSHPSSARRKRVKDSAALGSACTTNVLRGGRRKPRSHRTISRRSA